VAPFFVLGTLLARPFPQDVRLALGERLAASHRVIMIDRPGHGGQSVMSTIASGSSPTWRARASRRVRRLSTHRHGSAR
jgi:pimeloyl-ACP methyl ester carboxylesterase